MITNIIKVKYFETRCDRCGVRFCFENEDFEGQREPDKVFGTGAYNEYVICPVCGKHNSVRRTFVDENACPRNDGQITDNIAIHWEDKDEDDCYSQDTGDLRHGDIIAFKRLELFEGKLPDWDTDKLAGLV